MKKLITMMAVVAVAGAVSAQVFSDNVVGYNKASSTDANDGLQIHAVQFLSDSATTVESVYGAMPDQTKVYVFDNTNGYSIATYSDFGGGFGFWANGGNDLSGNLGHWVEIPSGGGAIETVIAGEVESAASVTKNLRAGLELVCYPYPVAVQIQDLGLTPNDQDKVYVFDNAGGYTIATYTDFGGGFGFWANGTVVVAVGEGFWYENNGSAYDWVVTKPF